MKIYKTKEIKNIALLGSKGSGKTTLAEAMLYRHHGAYKGALFDHSLQVAYELINLTERLGLKWERKESPAIVGMLHDLCKIDA